MHKAPLAYEVCVQKRQIRALQNERVDSPAAQDDFNILPKVFCSFGQTSVYTSIILVIAS